MKKKVLILEAHILVISNSEGIKRNITPYFIMFFLLKTLLNYPDFDIFKHVSVNK